MTQHGTVGVLTFHKCINYGSYWQARCLVEGLRARGFAAELLDHECDDVRLAEWRCSLQPSLPQRTPRARLGEYKRKTRKFFDAWRHLPLSGRFSLHHPEQAGRYDKVVIGSDEVWNFRHPWYSGKPIFYGDGLRSERLISYAATFGNHDAADGFDPKWAGKLKRFSALSVRDENSRSLVSGALGIDPALVLDPCLQFPDAIPNEPAQRSPYALIYGHGFPEWLQQRVRQWSDARGLTLLSVGYHNAWADEQALGAGPIEFAPLVKGASAVVTNFFHGCVFALLRDKPLVTTPSDYRFNKIRDLTAALNASERIVNEASSPQWIGHLLETPLGGRVHERVVQLRAQSHAFLDAALA
ncbi:MAG: polysaccharide pyruvyl transferase family protein [Sphingomicrobium sp.]|nr:polysaccharide pyruvyl transferase family protein [Sphingomonadales bacterium]